VTSARRDMSRSRQRIGAAGGCRAGVRGELLADRRRTRSGHLIFAPMKRRLWIPIGLVCALFALGVSALGPPPALASASAVLADCQRNGKLTRPYPIADLQQALATMPVLMKQYSDCYDVIQNALQDALKGIKPAATPTGGSGGSLLPTWLIVVLVLLVLAAATFGAIAVRRRRGPPPVSP
jgi:hypothetical protein